MGKVIVVVGAQYGSEAKGHVTDRLVRVEQEEAQQRHGNDWADPVLNVRVGGPNAGHTVYVDAPGEGRRSYALRQLPVGAFNAKCRPVIAAGSEVEVAVLLGELEQRRAYFEETGVEHGYRVLVDQRATLVTESDKALEGGNDGPLQRRLGSTGKGIGAARVKRLNREPGARLCDQPEVVAALREAGCDLVPTAHMLNQAACNSTVVIEGTQGHGLGLWGRDYPFCTSGGTDAVDFLAQARIAPNLDTEFETWLVARTFPIRVAGNSGPLYAETTWDELGLPEERTTVTKKVRRVGQWDVNLLNSAIRSNGGYYNSSLKIAITMLDQKFPQVSGVTTLGGFDREVLDWIVDVEKFHKSTVRLVTTGPDTGVFI